MLKWFPCIILSSYQNPKSCLFKNKAFNKNQETFSDSHHIILPRKHNRFIIWTHLGWNYKWELCRETSWEHFGLNRRMILYSINWGLWLCDTCHAVKKQTSCSFSFQVCTEEGGTNGKRKGKTAAPCPLCSTSLPATHAHTPLHEEFTSPDYILKSHNSETWLNLPYLGSKDRDSQCKVVTKIQWES